MANFSQNGIPGVASPAYLQPIQTHRFSVTFRNIGSGGTSNSRDLSMQITSFNRPQLDFEEIQLDRYVTKAYVASKYTWSETQFTFEDDVNSRAISVIRDQLELQQRLIGSDSGAQFLNAAPTGSSYKHACDISMLDGNETVLQTWHMQGCWIRSCTFGQLDYAGTDALKVDITMRFDHCYLTIGSQNLGTALGGY